MWAEEKLTVEVALLNGIHVRDGELASAGAETDHRKVLEKLAANGTSTDLSR